MPTLIPLRAKGAEPPLFLVHDGGGGIMFAHEIAQHLKSDRPIHALQPPIFSGAGWLKRTIEATAADYLAEIRAVQPRGPYYLGGYSFGGRVAFEMAQKLVRSGERVAFLGLIDTRLANPETVKTFATRHTQALKERSFAAKVSYLGIHALKKVRHCASLLRNIFWRKILTGSTGRFLRPQYSIVRTELFLINKSASGRYAPLTYPGAIVAFSARGETEAVRTYWQGLAGGGLTIVELPAGHAEIVRPPYSAVLARHFDEMLERPSQP